MLARNCLIAAALVALPVAAYAQDMSIGQAEYMNSCAQCHGAGGMGDGPMVGFLNTSVPDLTQLQANNNGVFPVSAVYSMIDGTSASGVHGTDEMPAWGQRYSADAPDQLGWDYSAIDRESFVRGRILALVEYIASIQQ